MGVTVIVNFFAKIGSVVLGAWKGTVEVLGLLFDTIWWLIFGPLKNKFVKSDSIFHQMVFAGVGSLVIAMFVAFFTGIVIAMQSAYQLSRFGANIYVAPMVAISLARELGPVLTALVVTGRVGAAIAAELGTMKVSEQIEALETMALNPIRFLVIPRFLALLVMLPCLTILADLVGIFGGFLVGVFSLDLDPYRYITFSFKYMAWKDVWTGLVKSGTFALIISMIGCYMGLNTKGGAEGVGKSTTLSVVTSFILIILFDCILTGVFYFAGK
ncbi:MAG: ABC transporter permease [Candidatus Omnitrophica bacterium]|nr:ABC transporter permease [Candidatus Omnitrophota bacterium]MCM8791046.1 ABC transporter permease [Candidatus Omnitrophota bacterium]